MSNSPALCFRKRAIVIGITLASHEAVNCLSTWKTIENVAIKSSQSVEKASRLTAKTTVSVSSSRLSTSSVNITARFNSASVIMGNMGISTLVLRDVFR